MNGGLWKVCVCGLKLRGIDRRKVEENVEASRGPKSCNQFLSKLVTSEGSREEAARGHAF